MDNAIEAEEKEPYREIRVQIDMFSNYLHKSIMHKRIIDLSNYSVAFYNYRVYFLLHLTE